MHVQHLDFGTERTEDYRFTTDGSFVSVDESGRPTVDLWESDDGQWFIQCHYRQDAWLEEDKTCEGQTSLFD